MSAPASRPAPTAPIAARVFASFLMGRAVYGLTYIAAAVGRLPILWYAPLAHTWEIARKPSGPAMGWYGLTAMALLAAGVSGGLTFLASARGPLSRSLARASVILAIAHAGGLVLLVDFAYFGWALTHEAPKPWAEPACPRGPDVK